MLDPRGQLLRAAVGFAGCSMPRMTEPFMRSARGSTHGLRLDTSPWACTRQGYDLQLTQYNDRGARKLGADERREFARKASRARWSKARKSR